jgi:hypothetical protein
MLVAHPVGIANLNRKINNLIKLAEDVADDNELTNMKGRMVELQKQKRELTILLNEVAEEQDLHEELERELFRFEAWAARVRPVLDDPDFTPSYEGYSVSRWWTIRTSLPIA